MEQSFYETPIKQFKWNWGAFMYSIIFGFANRAWLTFLCLIPGLNIIWIFVCGAMAEKWVWNHGDFEDGRTFRAVMDSWNRAGWLAFIIAVVLVIVGLILGTIALFSFGDILFYHPYNLDPDFSGHHAFL